MTRTDTAARTDNGDFVPVASESMGVGLSRQGFRSFATHQESPDAMSRKPFLTRSVVVVCVVTLSVTLGCSTVLQLPPESGEMENVYLLSYSTWGHHSVAFYRDRKLVEFTYGDWDLFALNRRDGWTAWKNMTFLTQGALGRKVASWTPGLPICPLFKDCLRASSFRAPASKSAALYNRLQAAYSSQASTEVFNEVEQVYFVKYAVSYWGFHNCNHEVANWLEELGADVSGRLLLNPDFLDGMRKP